MVDLLLPLLNFVLHIARVFIEHYQLLAFPLDKCAIDKFCVITKPLFDVFDPIVREAFRISIDPTEVS